IVERVELFRHLRQFVIDDWRNPPLVILAYGLRGAGHRALHRFRSLEVLVKERAEIGGKTLADPEMVPIGLGDRVAEPLVCDLMRNRPLSVLVSLECLLGV